MKTFYLVAVLWALVMTGAHPASNPAMAGQSLMTVGQNLHGGQIAENSCGKLIDTRTSKLTEPKSNTLYLLTGLAGPGDRVIYVTCGADQWCCKHSFGSSGKCTKCCTK